MNKKQKRDISLLTGLFLKQSGLEFSDKEKWLDYDFSAADLRGVPKDCWNKALIAYAFFFKSSSILEHRK